MRKSGILLHISSVPSPYGIGTFGKEAYKFIDFLKESNQAFWQILPIGPTSYGDSPYQTFSGFAGNHYFIDLDFLIDDGLLVKEDINIVVKNNRKIDYALQFEKRLEILKRAFLRFDYQNETFIEFTKTEANWLNDYALFMALKEYYKGDSWQNWDLKHKKKDKIAIEEFKNSNSETLIFWQFVQYIFYNQWKSLKKYANQNHISIIGDMPIYVALDSADVWANPKDFDLGPDLTPVSVAGVPPDGFSEFGQLWGNPLYSWDKMEKTGYKWWIKRVKFAISIFDKVRIDHFIGFDHFFAIPVNEKTAVNGKWKTGPGYKLFSEIEKALGKVDIIAEDLGDTNDSVRALLKKCGFPGMKLTQFAFYDLEKGELPCSYKNNIVTYTGTHDNMTTKSFLKTLPKEVYDFILEYTNSTNKTVVDGMIKVTLSSPANIAIIPLQDYLNLGDEGRMNEPATLGKNWVFRVLSKELNTDLKEKIKKFTLLFNRG